MVLCGKVNKQLVTRLQAVKGQAVGLSGCDGQLLAVKAIDQARLGFVGEVQAVNVRLLKDLLLNSYIPVIAPLGLNEEGAHYNINADSAAAAIANGLGAKELVFVTDVDGIMKDNKILKSVSVKEIKSFIKDGTIYGGMIPKVNAALKSLSGSLKSVLIMNGKGTSQVSGSELKGTKIMKVPVTSNTL